MAGLTYPASAAPVYQGDTVTIDRFMQNPNLVTRRAQTLAMNRYISDALLGVPLAAQGGVIAVETLAALGTGRDPRAVSPLGDYPLVPITGGNVTAVQTQKFGQDTKVSDESVARLLLSPVDRAFNALVEQNVIFIDGLAMSGINTAVTKTQAASKAWATATGAEILTDLMMAVAGLQNLDRGFAPDRVAINPVDLVQVRAKVIATPNLVSPATAESILAGGLLNIEGLTFMPSNRVAKGSVLVVDSTRLGGMADEVLPGPGYGTANVEGAPAGIQAKSWRLEENDGYRLRVRRVTVPVIIEPDAAVKITGV